MKINFTKMHGLGNDFMVIDAINQTISLSEIPIGELSDRHFGVGFDQLLLVEKAIKDEMDFKYRIFNADGSEVEQCGNGARCFARFVGKKGLTSKNPIAVETQNTDMSLLINEDDTVKVDMGVPDLRYEEDQVIPVNEFRERYRILREKYPGCVLSVGNPHYVMVKDDIRNINIRDIAMEIQDSGFFPQGINVGFMQIDDRGQIQLRVYERGVGETLSCGSGACAAVIYGITLGLLDSQVNVNFEHTNSNVLVEYTANEHVFLSGEAEFVFEGEIEI